MAERVIEKPIPLIYRQILKEKQSGELIIRDDLFRKTLFFGDGNLVFAKTTVLQERLGEILFKLGKINQTQFWNIHKLLAGKNGRLGEELVKEKIITHKDLFFGLLYQFRTIAISVFSLASGEWHFTPKVPELPPNSKFNIELAGIIKEGMSKVSNVSFYKNNFYHLAPRATAVPEHLKSYLSPEAANFWEELGEYKNVPNKEVARRVSIPEEIYWKKVTLFYLLDILTFEEVAADRLVDKNIEEMIELYDKIKSQSIDYYELFGLKNTATVDEIRNVYFNYAKKYHPDRISDAPDPEIKEKANFVFAIINRAYDTLGNEDKKREYDQKGFKGDSLEDKIQENLIEKARVLYRKAKTLHQQKKYWEATSLLEEAVRLHPYKASYVLLLGLCQVYIPNLRRMAEVNLQKAIEMEPWNAEPYVGLGLLFFSEGLKNRASGFFKKALAIDPHHALAQKKLREAQAKTPKKGKSKK